MKKVLKRALIGLGCVLLLPILLFGFLFATREPPDGPRVDAGAGVVGVETGSTAKPGAARRDPSRALRSSSRPTAATSPDVSASAVLRDWPTPRRPSVTAVTHIAVATAALPTARRRRRPRGT